jgi:hypothetical protein
LQPLESFNDLLGSRGFIDFKTFTNRIRNIGRRLSPIAMFPNESRSFIELMDQVVLSIENDQFAFHEPALNARPPFHTQPPDFELVIARGIRPPMITSPD